MLASVGCAFSLRSLRSHASTYELLRREERIMSTYRKAQTMFSAGTTKERFTTA